MKIPHRLSKSILTLALALLGLAGIASAMFVRPKMVPVDRLIKNATTYLEQHPNEAQAHYTLARIHYLAFSLKSKDVPAMGRGADDSAIKAPAPQWMTNHGGGEGPGDFTKDQLIDHANKAQEGFKKALQLSPSEPLFQLGLASLLEEFRTWATAAQLKDKDLPEGLRDLSVHALRTEYQKAYQWSNVGDSKLSRKPLAGLASITSYEAAEALVRLAAEEPQGMSDAEKGAVKEAQEAMTRFQKLPRGAVTPIVFSFTPAAHLEELLSPDTVVDFDLRGYGARESWPWVKPSLGFLVWDSSEKGEVSSAREMFGSYTFQIFRATGYDALAALDDNGDGVLTGDELKGLSVWFDRNGDGRATPEEVIPLRKLGVVSIAVHADSQDGIHPSQSHGITLSDGRTLRTWDWIVAPVHPLVQAGAP